MQIVRIFVMMLSQVDTSAGQGFMIAGVSLIGWKEHR